MSVQTSIRREVLTFEWFGWYLLCSASQGMHCKPPGWERGLDLDNSDLFNN